MQSELTYRKTKKMLALEARFKKPIDKLLRDLYASLGNLRAVSEVLDTDVRTVWLWMDRMGVPRRRWMVPPPVVENEQEEHSEVEVA